MIESIDMTTEKGVAWGPDWQGAARFVGMCLRVQPVQGDKHTVTR